MSYVSDALAHRLREAGPAARFNILSAVLPVRTTVRAFGSTPAADINNAILGMPLLTVLDEFEQYARMRTPVLTNWAGIEGADGRDVFGACPLQPADPTHRFVPDRLPGTSGFPEWDETWFGLPAAKGTYVSAGLHGMPPYLRASRDGHFFAGGYMRLGQLPYSAATEPGGDNQNTSPIYFEDVGAYGTSGVAPWAVSMRSSTIQSDQSHTYGPNSYGISHSQSVAANQGGTKCWLAFSTTYGTVADFVSHTKIYGAVGSTVTALAVNLGPIYDAKSNTVGKRICFGNGPTLVGIRNTGGQMQGVRYSDGRAVATTYASLGGFYLGRRALASADMEKLYYSPGGFTIWLRPWQNPVRSIGYLDQMSAAQISKLLVAIAAGTVDPQYDAPSAVWDAVR